MKPRNASSVCTANSVPGSNLPLHVVPNSHPGAYAVNITSALTKTRKVRAMSPLLSAHTYTWMASEGRSPHLRRCPPPARPCR
ncbi:hypothetical protein SBA3_1160025 [Candidatus Sulfopaludibacter sp. SbA3]|nr:hypothetical protein SBA3_1160025 [Candidatus Sulfopaludibacter sp. SbA3]